MEALFPSSNNNSSGWTFIQQGHITTWTKEENKAFESALAIYDDKTPNRWYRVANMIPGKSVYDVMNQYRELVSDVSDIEAGLVPIPGYLSSSSFTLMETTTQEVEEERTFNDLIYNRKSTTRPKLFSEQEQRRKGVPWTEDEHRRFLLGLQKHGKGDWRNISRNFVISKTPTQVASHAQKYYQRQLALAGGKDKRRPSIHDITTTDHLNSHTTKLAAPPLKISNGMMKLGNTSKILMDLTCKNVGSSFESTTCGNLIGSYPCDIATNMSLYS